MLATLANSITFEPKIVANLKLPEETRTPPEITHSSIARYQTETDLELVREAIAAYDINIKEEVSEFVLIKNIIPPLQKYEVLRTYPLIGHSH